MMLLRPQINYMPAKSHEIITINNTQGQIVQIRVIKRKSIAETSAPAINLCHGKQNENTMKLFENAVRVLPFQEESFQFLHVS